MKKNLRNIDIPLLIVTIILVVVGLIMVFSSSSIAAVLQYNQNEFYFFKRQLYSVLICVVMFFIIVNIDTKKYNYISILLLLVITGLLFALTTYGVVVNSANSWFKFKSYSMQPSEIAKPIIILYLACIYGSKKGFKTTFNLLLPLIPCIVIFGLVVLEPDLGTATIIASICMFIFFSLPISRKKMLLISAVIIGGSVLLGGIGINLGKKYLTQTQINRFTYKEPCKRYLEDTGYQVCNGYIAINNGGLFGKGLSKSTQKYLYLPEAHTDFIFPIIVEELGLIGGIVILLLYLFMLFRILVIARNARDLRGSIIAFGTFAYIFSHIFVNIGGLLAFIPETGIPLPLLSYGGSSMLSILTMLSLTQRVAIESKNKGSIKNGKR